MTPQQHYETAQQLHRDGNYAEAERHYREVLRQFGEYAGALVRLGQVCFLQNKFEAAAEVFRRAVVAAPRDAVTHAGLGCSLNALGRPAEALTEIDAALVLAPERVISRLDRANALIALGRPAEAVAEYEAVLTQQPGSLPTLVALGTLLNGLARTEQAMAVWERALQLQPGRTDLHLKLGTMLQDMEQHEDAVEHFRAAEAMHPDTSTRLALARSLSALGERDEAMALIDAIVAEKPRNIDALFERGRANQRWGDFAAARRSFEQALALNPDLPAVWYAWVSGERIHPDHPAVAALQAMPADRFPDVEQVSFHFAQAKVCDDLSRHDEAFEHWQAGHAVQRRLTPYDEADEVGLLARIAELFSREFLDTPAGVVDPSDLPVFIVGMPRSGTTLVEQMLASHPQVFGAGEAADLSRLYDALNAGDRQPTRSELAVVGARYVERMRRRAPEARRITDKMPGNFAAVGLIAAALPNARIIHVRRDPLDTCFSCWTNLFHIGHRYTHDLGTLGRYYRAYERLMAHWRHALPEGRLIEVRYEDLVTDFAAEARRIVAACGLDWDEACLEFHKTERPVGTASAFQVRQPLYRSAIGRAAPYTDYLEPLRKALVD